jgi:hypothetical protein
MGPQTVPRVSWREFLTLCHGSNSSRYVALKSIKRYGVQCFGCFTAELIRMAKWLQQRKNGSHAVHRGHTALHKPISQSLKIVGEGRRKRALDCRSDLAAPGIAARLSGGIHGRSSGTITGKSDNSAKGQAPD